MIITSFDPKHGRLSALIESPEDLWVLRRLIRKGDVVVTKSSKVVKREEEYSRPDKGERVKVTIALEVEEVHLDSSVGRIRIRGTIKEASDETISRTGTHAQSLSPGHAFTLRKVRWSALDIRLVNSSKNVNKRFILIAIDRREAGVGTLSGSHLAIVASIDSGLGGKMSQEQSSEPFFRKVLGVVKETSREGDTILVAGPGHTKLTLGNLLSDDPSIGKMVRVIEGFDLAGADGVRGLLKFPGFHKVAADSSVVEIQGLVNEAVKRISTNDGKVAYSLPRVREAAVAGAIDRCAVTDFVFSGPTKEDEVVDTMNTIEAQGGKVYLADSSLEFGKQVSAFGGIVALLRYAFRTYQSEGR
ncbi:MAG: hypothetical protein OK422_02635 [Thaumarchaeota archaeon]|nr:hypothetical protein [Nitrososphaerota archaeon]